MAQPKAPISSTVTYYIHLINRTTHYYDTTLPTQASPQQTL